MPSWVAVALPEYSSIAIEAPESSLSTFSRVPSSEISTRTPMFSTSIAFWKSCTVTSWLMSMMREWLPLRIWIWPIGMVTPVSESRRVICVMRGCRSRPAVLTPPL